jgi:hypothetical protein
VSAAREPHAAAGARTRIGRAASITGACALVLVVVAGIAWWRAGVPTESETSLGRDLREAHRANAPSVELADAEFQPAREHAVAPAAEMPQPPVSAGEWTLAVHVVDDQRHDLANALVSAAQRQARTDAAGRCALELPIPTVAPQRVSASYARAGSARPPAVSVLVSAPGRADAYHTIPSNRFEDGGGRAELLVTLRPGAELAVRVVDQHEIPVAKAIVVLNLLGGAAKDDTRDSARLSTDERGEAHAPGLLPGAWKVQAVGWRGVETADSIAVELVAGANAPLTLAVTRLARGEYASGRVILGPFAGDGTDTSGAHLRKVDVPQRTAAIFDDGTFFVTDLSSAPESWELARDQRACSEAFPLALGLHGVVVEWTCR